MRTVYYHFLALRTIYHHFLIRGVTRLMLRPDWIMQCGHFRYRTSGLRVSRSSCLRPNSVRPSSVTMVGQAVSGQAVLCQAVVLGQAVPRRLEDTWQIRETRCLWNKPQTILKAMKRKWAAVVSNKQHIYQRHTQSWGPTEPSTARPRRHRQRH